MSEVGKTIGTVVFFAAALGFTWAVFSLSPDDPDTCGTPSEAYVMAQGHVAEQLKDPESAEFPSITAPGVSIRQTGCDFELTAYVDATNSFGASVRTPFAATLTFDPGSRSWSGGVTLE